MNGELIPFAEQLPSGVELITIDDTSMVECDCALVNLLDANWCRIRHRRNVRPEDILGELLANRLRNELFSLRKNYATDFSCGKAFRADTEDGSVYVPMDYNHRVAEALTRMRDALIRGD